MSAKSEFNTYLTSESEPSPLEAFPELKPTVPGAMHSNGDDTESELDANVRFLFDRSVSNVQTYSSRIQQAYFSPAYERAKTFSEVYPVLSLCIGIFSVLSLLPVTLFVLTSMLVLSGSVFVALSLSLLFSASVISVFGLFLFGTLFLLSLLSISFTVLIVGAYLLLRFIAHIREQPTWRAGVKHWGSELQVFIRSRFPERRRKMDADASITKVNGDGAEVSDKDVYVEKMPEDQRKEDHDPVVTKEAREGEVLVAMED